MTRYQPRLAPGQEKRIFQRRNVKMRGRIGVFSWNDCLRCQTTPQLVGSEVTRVRRQDHCTVGSFGGSCGNIEVGPWSFTCIKIHMKTTKSDRAGRNLTGPLNIYFFRKNKKCSEWHETWNKDTKYFYSYGGGVVFLGLRIFFLKIFYPKIKSAQNSLKCKKNT